MVCTGPLLHTAISFGFNDGYLFKSTHIVVKILLTILYFK